MTNPLSPESHMYTDLVWRAQRAGHFQPLTGDARKRAPHVDDTDDEPVLNAAMSGINFFQSLQADEGHWPGEYGGPMFLMPGAIITMYITGTVDSILNNQQYKDAIIQYLRNQERTDTGGWGIDIERHATQFGTVLNYVVLRLLGVRASDPVCIRARDFIHKHGGAVSTPSWGKFWLACLGAYEWDGYNSVLPELWLTPVQVQPNSSR